MTEKAAKLTLDLVRRFEGFRAAPYQCSAKVWTIGYGSTRDPAGRRITQATPSIGRDVAQDWATADLQRRARITRRLVRVRLTDGQMAALTDFTYNLGSGALKASTLRQKLNRGDYEGASREFRKWVFAGGRRLRGLVRRRAAEKTLFSN